MLYLEKPQRFAPERNGRLDVFLAVVARRKLLNLQRGEARRLKAHERAGEEFKIYFVSNGPRPVNTLLQDRLLAPQEKLEALVGSLLPRDQAYVALWMEGKTRSADFAGILGIEQMDSKAQVVTVRRTRDRVFKCLKRKLKKCRDDDEY